MSDHRTVQLFLASGDILAIERHDEIIGFYIPVRPAREEKTRPALDRPTKAVTQVIAETGMEEEALTEALRPATRRCASGRNRGRRHYPMQGTMRVR